MLEHSPILGRLACFGEMESMNGSSSGRPVPGLPFDFHHSSTSYFDFSPIESKGNPPKCTESFHQRCSSESFLMEEQPSWLDDLLDESETPVIRGHRRSASDTYAYLGQAVETFNIRDQSKYQNAYIGTSTGSRNLVHCKVLDSTSIETKTCSLENKKESNIVVSTSAEEQNREESSPQNLEGSTQKASGSQAKPSAPKIDAKRAKQNTGHRSRVRKLQYIGQLERTVQLLQAEGCEVSAEFEFLEQHNTILTMENKALRQRLESLSQELLIKNLEQEMLRREIGRMQTLFQLQKRQPIQLQQPLHQQHSRQHRNRSRDFKTNQVVSE
ncbi:Basic-leucine zipper (bZIP) transcription factor family protein [Abeliophyllum distichum]|uniref:Basic-leucine zipper (BZIP) transcription factor family protein n=1 Tax=Abeliophyllum distichum TaxID=126358 RepID=A0ABD1SRY8_9LAMI